MDLVTFLRARLDEDEAIARAAIFEGCVDWAATYCEHCESHEGTGIHIARHDPARVLADVAAKRARLDKYVEASVARQEYSSGVRDTLWMAHDWNVRIDAAVYSSHPDYDETWRP